MGTVPPSSPLRSRAGSTSRPLDLPAQFRYLLIISDRFVLTQSMQLRGFRHRSARDLMLETRGHRLPIKRALSAAARKADCSAHSGSLGGIEERRRRKSPKPSRNGNSVPRVRKADNSGDEERWAEFRKKKAQSPLKGNRLLRSAHDA